MWTAWVRVNSLGTYDFLLRRFAASSASIGPLMSLALLVSGRSVSAMSCGPTSHLGGSLLDP